MECVTEDDDSEEEGDTVSSEPVTPTLSSLDFPVKLQKGVGHLRRRQLPSPRLEAPPGLFSLLRKHIGEPLLALKAVYIIYIYYTASLNYFILLCYLFRLVAYVATCIVYLLLVLNTVYIISLIFHQLN